MRVGQFRGIRVAAMARVAAHVRPRVGRRIPLVQVGLFCALPRPIRRRGDLEVASRATILLGSKTGREAHRHQETERDANGSCSHHD